MPMPELKDAAIAWLARCWRTRFTLLIVCIAGLGTAHILVRTATYGAAIGEDATIFLSTALNFLAGEGWLDLVGRPLVGWPPLFPLLLAAFGWVGIEPLEAGRWINATAFGLTILAAGLWLHSNLRSRLLTLVATAIIAASLPLSHLASSFLTEPLFVLFTLLALIQLGAFLNCGGRTSLLLAAVFTALAALTRYQGPALIAAGVLLLLLCARLKHTLVFVAISSVPLLAVLVRNWAVSGTLTGPRSGVGQSLFDGLSQTVDVFREWVVPSNAPGWFGYLLWLAFGVVVLASAAVVLRTSRAPTRDAADSPSYFRLRPALPFGVFAGVYLSLMAVVPLFVLQAGIESRYLLPVYVPLLLAAMLLLDRFLSIKATGRMAATQYGVASLVLLGACAHVGSSAHRNLTITAEAWVAGFGIYNNDYCATSEILNYLRDTPIDGRIYSNNCFLAWFWDRTAAPGKYHYIPDQIHSLTSVIHSDSDSAHIVWSRSEKSFYDFDDLDIRVLPGVEPVAELADGVVFRVTAAEPFDAKRHRARKQRYVQQRIEQAGELVIHADSTWPVSTWGVERTDEQVARAGWDMYRNGRKLTYRKQPCAPDDVQAKFVLQVSPDEPAYLSADRRQYGFDHLDFNFRIRGGVRLDEQCVVTAQLPDYPISHLYIGRWMAGNDRMLWEVKAESFKSERHPAQRQRYAEQLIAQSADWGVYRTGRKLTYHKQPCAPDDVQAKFILHVTPADPNDLPANRQRHGFESFSFYFDQRGFQLDDQCIAIAQLPAYPIDRIRVGQWISKGNRTVWEAEFLEISE